MGQIFHTVDWVSIQADYDNGLSYRGIYEKYKISSSVLTRAKNEGLFSPRSRTTAMVLNNKKTPRVFSEESRKKLSEEAKVRGLGGKRNSYRIHYNGVILDSTYEYKVAIELDNNNVKWIRPKRLPWVDKLNVKHSYTPDFYLPEYDVYLDPKHDWLIKNDKQKIDFVCAQNKVKVIVLDKDNLTWQSIRNLLKA